MAEASTPPALPSPQEDCEHVWIAASPASICRCSKCGVSYAHVVHSASATPTADNTRAALPSGWQPGDDKRWDTIEKALTAKDLGTPRMRLIAIGLIVNSRKPLTEADLQRSRELAARLGWENAPPEIPHA